jgi:eukaryotic-like serine/threonine-protein kinase
MSASSRLAQLASWLDEVLALPEGEREAWVDANRALSEDMRQQLKVLLASGGRGFTLPALPAYDEDELHTREGEPGAEDQVGPYRLIHELGRGGMGSVWFAERIDGAFRRQLALKLPHSSLPHRQLAERFARERDILASLEHPHIARLYDAGVTREGHPYLALEYVEGRSLLEYCQAEHLGLKRRLQLFLQVLEAVQYAHGRLVVHRDLKPSNILVTAEGSVRLLDFGIAKLMDEESSARTQLTEIGGRLLTPQYAAPEQILGQAIGTGTDIYSLGVLLYELLAGNLPYRLKRETRGALEESILDVEPPPASEMANAGTFGWSRHLRGDLDTILGKALKKDPAERYPTAAAFADDLHRYLSGEAVLAQPDSLHYRAGKFVGRHRWAVAATGIVFLSLSGGMGLALWQANIAAEQASIARKEALTAEAVTTFMQGIFLANSAQQGDPVKARQTTARQLLDIGATKLETDLADAPDALNTMLWLFSELYSQLLLPDEATRFAQQRLALIRQHKGARSIELGEALLTVFATSRSAWLDDPRQPELIAETLSIFADPSPEQQARRRTALANSAEYWADHDFPRALREVRAALAIRTDVLVDASFPPKIAAALELLAGEPSRAKDAALRGLAAERALEERRESGMADPGDGGMLQTPTLLHLLAHAHWALGERDEAVNEEKKALAAAEKLFGDADPETARYQAGVASFLSAQGELAAADALLSAAASTLATGRPDDRSRLRFHALASLGKAQLAADRHATAVETLTKTLALRDPILTASPAIAEILRDLARGLIGLNRKVEAGNVLDRAVAMREKSGIKPPAVLDEEADIRRHL